MNIFITGGTGFIGKNLVESLAKSGRDKIFCYVRRESMKKDVDFLSSLGCVITYSLDDISKCKHVFHLAGQLQKFNLPSKVYYDANIVLTQKIISQCKQNQKIIFLSTTGVHGPGRNIDEKTRYNPRNIYEKTKLSAELLVKKYTNHVIIRPGLVYGKYNENLQGFYKSIKRRLFFIIGNGKNKIQPINVLLLIDVLIKSMDTKFKNDIFIVAGKKITFEKYYYSLAKSFGVKPNRIKIPRPLAIIIVYFYQNLSKIFRINPIVTLDGLNLLTQTRTYNISKTLKNFNFIG